MWVPRLGYAGVMHKITMQYSSLDLPQGKEREAT